MSLFVRLDAVGPYAKSECNARHHSYYRLNGMLPQPLTSVGTRPRLAAMTTRAQASNDCEAAADRCLAAIAAPAGEGARTYTQVYASSVLKEAAAADERRSQGSRLSALDGKVVAIKDLFDIQGQITWAGSVVLRDSAAATHDAAAVARLRRAGVGIIGKTNMTEFAYSGVGLNPHFGTPANPCDRAVLRRIPGGSSSGAAVAVADGMAEIGLGTDTGGSVRIPAALCGLVGWKPTARRISLEGVWPLAPSFDSVGVIARCVRVCAEADAVLTGTVSANVATPVNRLRLGRLRGYVESDLEPAVASAYERALDRLIDAGVEVIDVNIPSLERVLSEQPGVAMTALEAYRTHAALLERFRDLYDPRVRSRLELGRKITAEQYAAATIVRKELQQAAGEALQRFDAWTLPSVTMVAPPFSAFESDERYLAINRALLRNTSLVNLLDGCAVTLPCQDRNELPVGLSVAGLGVRDASVLVIAQALEPLVAGTTS
jgi:aspartyl-tRNA(Asn)/glutamyl-tRNA(Gln) amidotransferase subunit A